MQFHTVHGNNARVSKDGSTVKRKNTFCHGICFSKEPVGLGQRVTIEITETCSDWSGALRIGFTTNDPSTWEGKELPRYAVPDLTNHLEGYWAVSIPESSTIVGNQIMFVCDSTGKCHYYVNNKYIGPVMKSHVPNIGDVRLWALVDVYGFTSGVRFVNDNGLPLEIRSRGPEAMEAFATVKSSGTKPMFRTRLMLVGQNRAGKTSLKKSLTGQCFDKDEQSTDGIDTEYMCDINVTTTKGWDVNLGAALKTAVSIDGMTNLEDEYDYALAKNIVLELLRAKEKPKEAIAHPVDTVADGATKPKSDESDNENLSTRDDHLANGSSSNVDDNVLEETLAQRSIDKVPEKVASIVNELLNNGSDDDILSKLDNEKSNRDNLILHIWDFAGQNIYYTTHQVFLTYRAVYIIVFDLTQDLYSYARTMVRTGNTDDEWVDSEMTNLDFIDFWLNNIFTFVAQNTDPELSDSRTLSPPVFIVGTHKQSLDPDPQIQVDLSLSKIKVIREHLRDKPYYGHVVNSFYFVENGVPEFGEVDPEIVKLRRHIEEVTLKEPYMGEHIPLQWLKFESLVAEMLVKEIYFISYNKLKDLLEKNDVADNDDVHLTTMLTFYHDLGKIIFFGSIQVSDARLHEIVILKPQWLINVFKKVITINDVDSQWSRFSQSWHTLDQHGILDDCLIDHMWRDILPQKEFLLGLMEKFDLLCERLPPKNLSESNNWPKSYFVPARLKSCTDVNRLYVSTPNDVVFYLKLDRFLPEGFFNRLLSRAVRWSQELGGREPSLYHRKARLFLDDYHDCVLEMESTTPSRIRVTILRVDYDSEDTDDSSNELPVKRNKGTSNPESVAKVRNFLESTMCDLKEIWVKNISYETVVECPCPKLCQKHSLSNCNDNDCMHFLNLDECLARKFVLCQHTRVKTTPFKRWFPQFDKPKFSLPVITPTMKQEELPLWIKAAAKLLSLDPKDAMLLGWCALGRNLGYKEAKLDVFHDEENSALSLLSDWILSSGNQRLSIDMLVSCLGELHREDVIEIIRDGQEHETQHPSVFISYQWDIQDEVRVMRDHLEQSGYSCWMDIGQMGGGDHLYQKIDEGIRNCKVMIACITPKYVSSHNCVKEVTLADLVKRSIIPVVFKKVRWPPPGPLSLLFSPLIFISLNEAGGHGGSGIHADRADKYNDIVQRLGFHCEPVTPIRIVDGTELKVVSKVDSPPPQPSETQPISAHFVASATDNRNQERQVFESHTPVERVNVSKCTVCALL